MSWFDILITQAVSTVIALAKMPDARSKWRVQLLKLFRTIAIQFSDDTEFAAVVKEFKK